jgi:hypothetical protein
MPNVLALLAYLMVAGLVAWAARMYLRDARAYRAGRGDERYAWLRRSHPDHPALPPAPPTPLLRLLPQRWGWRHLVIYAAQASVIGGLTYGMVSDMGLERLGGFLVTNIILVAFATAVLTRLWDASMAALARRRAGSGEHQQAVGEGQGVLGARRRLGEGAYPVEEARR